MVVQKRAEKELCFNPKIPIGKLLRQPLETRIQRVGEPACGLGHSIATTHALPGTLHLTYDMIFTQPVCYEFKNIKAPTLLIIGQRDRTALGKPLVSEEVRKTMGNYPELGRKTHEAIKTSRLVELDNVGHLPHIEAFNRFIEPLIKFLKE